MSFLLNENSKIPIIYQDNTLLTIGGGARMDLAMGVIIENKIFVLYRSKSKMIVDGLKKILSG